METAVRLIIKAPNQQIEDQVINCQLDWTIARLKDHLAEVYPSKPKNSEQKLIYSGHLLKDHTSLKDVLRNYDGSNDQSFIVHLVCMNNKNFRDNSSNNSDSDDCWQNDQTEANVSHAQHPSAQFYSVPGYYGHLNGQQIAWMQHTYTQYMSHYMQMMAAQGLQLPNNVPYMQAMHDPANGQSTSMHDNIRDNEEPVRGRGQDGDLVNDDGPENAIALDRDWLESIFLCLRFFVLFGIVYFYSSPTRFIIVTLLGLAIHLYQGGFLRVNHLPQNEDNIRVDNNVAREDNANNARVEDDQNNQNNEADDLQPNEGPVGAAASDTRPEAGTNANEEHEAERPGALAFAWMFFSSFFASLIPDQPNVI